MNVFISYSRKDYEWVIKIHEHLVPFLRAAELVLFSDMDILPGEDWNARVKSFLESADIAILLISPSYLASEYIYNIELPSLLKVAQEKRTKLIPILVEKTLLEGEVLNFQFLNPFSEPLASLTEPEQNAYFLKLSRIIRSLKSKPEKKVGGDVKHNSFDRAIHSALANTGNINIVVGGDGNVFAQAEKKAENQ